MSLVGTRPILQDELLKYELHHRARIAIKPGITGMWQVSGRSDITDFEEVVRLDTEYISMPLFFLVSGFLSKKKRSLADWMKKKKRTLLVSYFVSCAGIVIASIFFESLVTLLNGKDCDVLIFPELIESVLVNSFVNQGILGNVALFHGFP